ncbi:MAG: L-seryl-tRNA(Sec) selenium transferase [Spirochaetaceae bacterium]|jgi:L-seryl-tRNA(Ser) seleniumtransferase|nr:L-seryl-tRNA(Sec) selenium transferase [Spirochaetaceae bacterium]
MIDSGLNAKLRSIPAMEELLNAPRALEFYASLGREQVKTIIACVLDEIRRELCAGVVPELPVEELALRRAETALQKRAFSTLKPVVNATGVVVHTNLGRAPLAAEALNAAGAIAGAYSTLEYSPESGGRGRRNDHIEWLICQITGAEAALAVNNNAAAVLLALSAVAAGREVIISCGELVEIGDSFRIPEILAFSGAKMLAVGCTNSVRIDDYRAAITENTAVLLKVHPSNYRVEGFVKSVSREALAELAASRSLVLMEDLGSGLLCRLKIPFAGREHSVKDCLEAGCDIVTFSGDKLLGGPQIGVIAGSKTLIDKMRGHQLLRALRVDKMTLAAFEATLRLYLSGRELEIPVVRMIEEDAMALQKKARNLCRLLRETAANAGQSADFSFSVVETRDAVGGGAFPANELAGFGVGVRSVSRGAESLAAALRAAQIPVISAVREGQVILHLRALLAGDEKRIIAAFTGMFAGS